MSSTIMAPMVLGLRGPAAEATTDLLAARDASIAAAAQAKGAADLAAGTADQVSGLLYINPITIDPTGATDTNDGSGTDHGTFFMEGTFGDGSTLIDTVAIYAATAVPACKVQTWQSNGDGSLTSLGVLMTVPLVDGLNVFTAAHGDFTAFLPLAGCKISLFATNGGMCKRGGTGTQTGLYFQGDRSGASQTGALYASFSMMVYLAGRRGSIASKVSAVDAKTLVATYPRTLDFDPCQAAAGGVGDATDNVTMFAPKTFGDMGMVGSGAVSGLRIRAEAAVAGAVVSLFDRSAAGHYTFIRDLWTGDLAGPALTTLVAGEDFDLTGAIATNTIGIYAPLTGIARSSNNRAPAYDAPYILGKFRGADQAPTNFRPTPPLIAATLLVADQPTAAPVYRLTTFFEGDQTTPALGTGSLAVYEGPAAGPLAGLAFPVRRTVSYTGLPADSYVRDPDVLYDATQRLYFMAHTSHAYGTGGPGAIFTIACSRNGVDYTYVASIDVSALVPGSTSAWGPQWFRDNDGTVYLLISTSPDGVTHTTRLLRSVDPTHRSFVLVGSLIGSQIPANSIDAQIVRLGSCYVLQIKDEAAKTIGAASATSILGPYNTPIPLGLDTTVPSEGGQLLFMPDRVRLYYDRYDDVRLRARDYANIGAAASAELAVDTGYQTPPMHGCVMLVTP